MITDSTVSGAYLGMLADTVREGYSFMQVANVTTPLDGDRINVDPSFGYKLLNFTFKDERTGMDWLEDRVRAMFNEGGEYQDSIRRDGQYDYVLDALKGMIEGTMPRWNANRLIISLFDSRKDLHKSRMPTPPCLIQLSFYPVKQTLSLIATFRAQYTDAKGYGNLYSLAMLLQKVCEETGFTPKHLFSVAQKAILKYPIKEAKRFRYALLKSSTPKERIE